MVVPSSPAGSNNVEKATMNEMMGYMGFHQNVSVYGTTGVSFGQKNTFDDSTFNFNIENKDTTTFRVNQPSATGPPIVEAKNGGAAPYYIQNKGIINFDTLAFSSEGVNLSSNQIYKASHNNTIANTFPSDYNNFTVASNYDDLCAINPSTFKGTYCNFKPNNSRLYCSDYVTSSKTNRGPFYDKTYNNLVGSFPVAPNIDLRTTGRDNHFFHLLQQEIDIDLGLGNLAPSRVAELITDQMKERVPNISETREFNRYWSRDIFIFSR